jgi:hypothetical protein
VKGLPIAWETVNTATEIKNDEETLSIISDLAAGELDAEMYTHACSICKNTQVPGGIEEADTASHEYTTTPSMRTREHVF